MRHGCFRAGPLREPRVNPAPDEHHNGRARVDFVLRLLSQAHAARRYRFPVEDREVDATLVEMFDDDRRCRDLDELQLREIWVRALPESECDVLTGIRVVAVDEDA